MANEAAQERSELPPCPGTGYFCRCARCVADLAFCAKLMRDIENGVPFGKGESGC